MIMNYFSPAWHPPEAKNYYNLYNDLNQTNDILYYDTTNAFINYPKIFTYKRLNNAYNFQLYKVVTNENSDDPVYSSNLPSTEGTFTINKIAPDNGYSSPSIDLYFTGIIQYEIYWDDDYPEGVGYTDYGATLTPDIFPSNSTISVHYVYTGRYVEEDYEYSGDKVVISCNWSTTKRTMYTANGTATLPAPTEALTVDKNIIPIVYIENWISSDYHGGGYIEWDGISSSEHALYDDNNKYCSLFAGTEVTVFEQSSDQYHIAWEIWEEQDGYYDWWTHTGWVPKSWISGNNPN